ncbi:hypothetical protein EDB87DRAFT_611527 [Lactarius vividus]|nr:hypothetical protein EDB87DRAFT_611527 [Lactarius vividus]
MKYNNGTKMGTLKDPNDLFESGSPVVDIRNSYGAAFVGLLVSTTLFGLTIAQTWIYFWNYRNRDPKPLKFFVAFVTFMDALHTIMCAYGIYWYLIANFGNVGNLQYGVWAMNLQVLLSIIINISVQLRVYIVSQSIICPIIIVVSVVIASCKCSRCLLEGTSVIVFIRVSVVFSIFVLIKEAAHKTFSSFHSLAWMSYVGLSAVTVGDTVVATSMCWSLYHKKTGFAKSDSVIMTLMAYSINSGLLTGLLSLATTISIVVSPTSLIWLAFFWAMTKCYVNSLLAMLNSRDYIRGRQSTTDKQDNAYNISSLRVGPVSEARVSFSVQRTTASDFGRTKSGHDEEPSLEVPKPVASFQSQA